MTLEFSKWAQEIFSPGFKARIINTYRLFPELQHKTINCGLLKRRGWIEGTAMAWTSPPVFRLQPNVSCFTIAHELMHLVQGNGSEIPQGEVSCDIWTMDRLPYEHLDQRPYYLLKNIRCNWKINKEAIKDLCGQAIQMRKTRRTYIVWLRDQINKLNES